MKKNIDLPLEEVLKILPKKTHNLEPFGLMFMINGDGKSWTVCYYTHYSKIRDDRFPIIKAKTLPAAANKLLRWMQKKMPQSFNSTKKVK